MQETRFTAGQTIFSEGDASDCAYTIRSGHVEILKASPRGDVRVAVLGEGDVVGEMGLLDERPRSATARALDVVVADVTSRAVFAQLLVSEPKRAMHLLRVLFERLRTMNRIVAEHGDGRDVAPQHGPVRLFPSTPEMRAALPDDGIEVARFPFRIGRKATSPDDATLSFNDLELSDAPPYLLSLNHFTLEADVDGVFVRDRGSQHGTLVNGRRIGASATQDIAPLRPGENEVIAGAAPEPRGSRGSPFRFRVVV